VKIMTYFLNNFDVLRLARRSFIPFLLAACFLTGHNLPCWAQESLDSSKIIHTPPKLTDLGQTISLVSTISNTTRYRYPMTLQLVRDGKLIRMRLPEGVPDIQDVPNYSFSTLAPLKTLYYTFYLEGPKKQIIQSQRFTLNRDCEPNTQPVLIPKVPNYLKSEEVAPMAEKVRLLEFENQALEQSIALLKDLEILLEGFKK
jgi:hypothetical protein